MKTSTTILLAFCFSSLIITGLALPDTYSLTVTDSATSSSNLPITVTDSTGTAASIKTSGSAATGNIGTSVATNTLMVMWTSGLPLESTYAVTFAANPTTGNAGTSDYTIVSIAVGNRLVTIGGMKSSTTSGGMQTALTATSACGDYTENGASGVVMFYLNAGCTVTLTQEDGYTGVIQYNLDSLSSTQQDAICTGLVNAATAAVSKSTAMCSITGTASGSTLAYWALTSSVTSKTDMSSVLSSLQSVIAAKTINVNGATQLQGFAQMAPASSSASVAAPSTTTAASLAAASPKSHSRMVVVAGVFTTALAAFFGLAF